MIYRWLEQEIASIKTPRFHVTQLDEPNLTDDLDSEIADALPESYWLFINKFGDSRLFRHGKAYHMRILSSPQIEQAVNGELLHIGHWTGDRAYFVCSHLCSEEEAPVYEEIEDGELGRVASSFEEWLFDRYLKTRGFYTVQEWLNILNYPLFSFEQEQIVAARREFKWRIVKHDCETIEVEIENNSSLVLPYFSLGRRTQKEGKNWESVVYLKTEHIEPGQKQIVKHPNGLTIFFPPESTLFFDLEDPCPEDIARYWEFRKL